MNIFKIPNLKQITYIETETDVDLHINNLKNNLSNINSITFNNLIYLEEIFKSYRHIDKIYYQFDLDCNRTNIKVNNKKINSIEEFEKHIGWLQNIEIVSNQIKNIYEYCVMLTLQSSYYFPLYVIHKLYCDNTENLAVTNSSTNRNIIINTFTEYLQIIIECEFKIINYHTSNIIKKINTTIYIKFKYTVEELKKNFKTIIDIDRVIDKNGLLVWEII